MDSGYKREEYKSDMGFELTHTIGESAEHSTISYPHVITNYLIYYFIKGSGNIKIEGNLYHINEGDIIMLNPSEFFCCTVDKGIFHERIVLHINEMAFSGFSEKKDKIFLPFYKREKGEGNKINSEDVKKLKLDTMFCEALKYMKSEDSTDEIIAACRVTEIMINISKYMIKEVTDNDKKVYHPVIKEIIEYINENFVEDITVPHISEKFNIDKSYLSHLFKEHVGTSLWSYVILRRIYYFNNLLKDNVNMEDASRRAGFNNYSNFFRLYRKYTGITPMQFKKNLKL